MNIKFQTIKQCYSRIDSWVISVIAAGILGYVFILYTNFDLIRGNLGAFHATATVVSQSLITILFGVNTALLWNKLKTAHAVNKKELGRTTFGSLIGLLVIGCPLCNITLASYLGIATVVSALPFFGLELKIASVALLLYSTNVLLKTANICEIPVKKQ